MTIIDKLGNVTITEKRKQTVIYDDGEITKRNR